MSEPPALSIVKSGDAGPVAFTIHVDPALVDAYLAKAEAEGKDLDAVINSALRLAMRRERGDKYGLSDEEIVKLARNDDDARFFVFHRSILRGLAEHPELFPSLPPCAPFIKDLEASIDDYARICQEDNERQERLGKLREAEQASKEELLDMVNSVIEYQRKLYEMGLIPGEIGPPPLTQPIPRVPGAPLMLRAENAPDAHVELTWEAPSAGTRVLSYEVERVTVPCRAPYPWTLAVTSLSTKVLLPETLGEVIMYQVFAVGVDGRGEPSGPVGIKVE